MSKRKSYDVSFKLKAFECAEKKSKEVAAMSEFQTILYTWWPLTTLSFTTEVVACESGLASMLLPVREETLILYWKQG